MRSKRPCWVNTAPLVHVAQAHQGTFPDGLSGAACSRACPASSPQEMNPKNYEEMGKVKNSKWVGYFTGLGIGDKVLALEAMWNVTSAEEKDAIIKVFHARCFYHSAPISLNFSSFFFFFFLPFHFLART